MKQSQGRYCRLIATELGDIFIRLGVANSGTGAGLCKSIYLACTLIGPLPLVRITDDRGTPKRWVSASRAQKETWVGPVGILWMHAGCQMEP